MLGKVNGYNRIEEIDNWFKLTTRIDKYFAHFNDYIFRGQSDADWPLPIDKIGADLLFQVISQRQGVSVVL